MQEHAEQMQAAAAKNTTVAQYTGATPESQALVAYQRLNKNMNEEDNSR